MACPVDPQPEIADRPHAALSDALSRGGIAHAASWPFIAAVMLSSGVSEVTATFACDSTRGRTHDAVSRPISP